MKHAVETRRKDARQSGRAPTSNGGAALASLPAVQRRRTDIGQILRRQPVQTKVAVGPAGDRYEGEADAVVARATAGMELRRPTGSTVLAQGTAGRADLGQDQGHFR